MVPAVGLSWTRNLVMLSSFGEGDSIRVPQGITSSGVGLEDGTSLGMLDGEVDGLVDGEVLGVLDGDDDGVTDG